MRLSRRDFIKIGTNSLLGGVIVTNVPSLWRYFMPSGEVAGADSAVMPGISEGGRHYWGFVCDTERCIGCGKCVVACKQENKVPWEAEYNRTWVERYVFTADGEVLVDSPKAGRDGFPAAYQDINVEKSFFVPKLCNQCDNPPCVTACPVGATYKTEDGVVLIDQEHCIGCGYCIQACPYGARYFLPDFAQTHFGQVRVVDKCNWCYHRIHRGLLPACVEVCPVSARLFGDLREPKSAVRQILAERRVYVLKPELGTEPKVYYIGFEVGVR